MSSDKEDSPISKNSNLDSQIEKQIEINTILLEQENIKDPDFSKSDHSFKLIMNTLKEKNYNQSETSLDLSKEIKAEVTGLYEDLSLVLRIKLKFQFPNLDFLKWPLIRDPKNFIYAKRSLISKTIFFYCSLYSTKKCKACIKFRFTSNESMNAFQKNDHLDIVHPKKREIDLITGKQKEITNNKDIGSLIKKEMAENPLHVNLYSMEKKIMESNENCYSILPGKKSIQDHIKNHKANVKISDLEMLNSCKSARNENWMRNTFMKEGNISSIFATDSMINKLKNKPKQLFFDGSFKVPHLFKQLLTIYMYDEEINFFGPIFFILTSSKKESNYANIFDAIKSELTSINEKIGSNLALEADYLMCDFEDALLQAIKKKVRGKQKGCFFHWMQALWRYAIKLKLKNQDTVLIIREAILALSLLCFIKQCNVLDCYEAIKNHYLEKCKNENFQEFFIYFEKNWLKGTYNLDIWNYFEEDKGINFINMQKTNNCVESFHNQLSLLLNRVLFLYFCLHYL